MGGAQVKGEKPECRRRSAFEEIKSPVRRGSRPGLVLMA
ncbi:hypothetical protein RBY4I_1875 [Rhodobacterales bacterium Y4I]|nr:hypothetical protein RBY4I_1875 [Rhodobacterales bacterium Y4I]